MTTAADARITAAPLPRSGGPRLILRICTNNPFYVLSAGLFLVGLWGSFGGQVGSVAVWALMSGLAGYTLLLAVTACLLVRFGNVWDDVRTVLLLVVLMFLATSVTFDEVLVLEAGRGVLCYLCGLALAVAVSEGLLRGMRLRLPALFRAPYYLILALFFLYPLALRLWTDQPRSEELMWGLFGFSAVAGLVFLTLLPAVRRGPEYTRDNGSPWPWPLYPWTLFGMLAFAVPARAFLLCWSMHLLAARDQDRLIFGPYFLIPFGLAVAAILLEIGIVCGRRGVLGVALALPAALVLLAFLGHRHDAIYRSFLDVFRTRLGGNPAWVALLAVAGFYAYAALRRVPLALDALTAALAALAFVGPGTLRWGEWVAPQVLPLAAAAALQLGVGLWQRRAGRCLLGIALAAAAALAVGSNAATAMLRAVAAYHVALAGVLAVGAVFTGDFGRQFRLAGALLVLLACLATAFGHITPPGGVPAWVVLVYPPILAALLAGYGLLLRDRPARIAAALALAGWSVAALLQGYIYLRRFVSGLDVITASLVLFAVAVLVSLGKAGVLARWAAAGQELPVEGTGPPPQAICCEADRVQANSAPQEAGADVAGTG
jgi:hypothetical protein